MKINKKFNMFKQTANNKDTFQLNILLKMIILILLINIK